MVITERRFVEQEQSAPPEIYYNLTNEQLRILAVSRGEGFQLELPQPDGSIRKGALVVNTGEFTGRVEDAKYGISTGDLGAPLWEKVNKPMDPDSFGILRNDVDDHLQKSDQFVSDLFVGTTPGRRKHVRVVTETAYHALFAATLFSQPTLEELEAIMKAQENGEEVKPDLTIYHSPSFQANSERHGTNGKHASVAVATNYDTNETVIVGTGYAGEIKKSAFTWMHVDAAKRGEAVVHSSAIRKDNGNTVIMMGLSGTGKSSMSADREVIGDDEHIVSDNGVENIENGVYIKVDFLNPNKEPDLYTASLSEESILENVEMIPGTKIPDFSNLTRTPNLRAAVPLRLLPNAVESKQAGQVDAVTLLTADGLAVHPPVAILDTEQLEYHLIAAYTSLMKGVVNDENEIKTIFSPCFAHPFLPFEPEVHAKLIADRVGKSKTKVLLNTGWTGGPVGVGERMDIDMTRKLRDLIVQGALDELTEDETYIDPVFGYRVPKSLPTLTEEENRMLNPENTWQDKAAFRAQRDKLAAMYQGFINEEFPDLPAEIIAAGPNLSGTSPIPIFG